MVLQAREAAVRVQAARLNFRRAKRPSSSAGRGALTLMTFVFLIPAVLLLVVLVAIIYRLVMVRPRTPGEQRESPDQIRRDS